jgi:hypothetical protein
MEGSNCHGIGKNQKGKNNSGGFPRWNDFGHQENCEQAERTKTRFGKTGTKSCDEGNQPSVRG